MPKHPFKGLYGGLADSDPECDPAVPSGRHAGCAKRTAVPSEIQARWLRPGPCLFLPQPSSSPTPRGVTCALRSPSHCLDSPESGGSLIPPMDSKGNTLPMQFRHCLGNKIPDPDYSLAAGSVPPHPSPLLSPHFLALSLSSQPAHAQHTQDN